MKTHPGDTGSDQPAQPNPAVNLRLEQRAREIAEIRGAGHSFTPEDLEQARRELSGDVRPPPTPFDSVADSGVVRDPSAPATQRGEHIADIPAEDEQEAAARLARMGVAEAQHEQMLAASRRKRDSGQPG